MRHARVVQGVVSVDCAADHAVDVLRNAALELRADTVQRTGQLDKDTGGRDPRDSVLASTAAGTNRVSTPIFSTIFASNLSLSGLLSHVLVTDKRTK